MSYPFVIQGNNVTVVIGNKPHTIAKTHITYQKVVDAIKNGDWETVKEVIDPKKVVLNYGQGNVSVQGDRLFWKGVEFNNALSRRMIEMLQEGFPIEPLVSFMENLMQNPSKRAVDELYGFLEKNNLPITPDGHFLAYKKVRDNFMDCHTGTMDNSPGRVVEMERNQVDDNRDNTCSAGLHFCSQEYLQSFSGARTVIVKINPRDVVSIPSDYNDAKGRACRYEVIGEIGGEDVDKAFDAPVQSNANNNIAKPVTKTGSTDFYMGYSTGYSNSTYSGSGKDYAEGYDKGRNDYVNGVSTPRYQYVEQPTKMTPDHPWPFAKS